jgi:N-acetylglucosamine-6-phosphate deacetylase
MSTRRLRCSHLATPSGHLQDGMLVIENGMITQARSFQSEDQEWSADHEPIEVVDGHVLPGFVDTHTHGGGGFDLATTDPEEVRSVLRFARTGGATSVIASLVTAAIDTIEDQLRTLVPLAAAGELAGIHLEGPFLSNAKRGAHSPGLLRDPDPESVDRLLAAADGRLSMITIAPELPGAIDAIRRFVAEGVRVAVGHTDGDDHAATAALDAGASVATHLFNAMPSVHHRNPGPIPKLLTDPRVMVELVCDGVHVHPDVLAMAIAAAGPERVALITDAMLATGVSDGEYSLGGLNVTVTDGVARVRTDDGSQGSIAGSTLTMRDAFGYCVQRLGLAIDEVSTMAAGTPASWHELDRIGQLKPGYHADLAVVDDQGDLLRVMYRGEWEELS